MKKSKKQTNEVKQLQLNLQIAKKHQQIQSTSKTTIQNAKKKKKNLKSYKVVTMIDY